MRINGQLVPDLLFPKDEYGNRDEILIVDFDTVCQSECENIALGLYQNAEYRKRFPKLNELINSDNHFDVFYNTAPFNQSSFFDYISDNTLSDEEKKTLAIEGFSTDTYTIQNSTMMMFALTELVDQKYIKKIIFYFNRPIYEHDIGYLLANFKDYADKIIVTDESLLSLAEEDADTQQYTTYMTSKVDDILEMMQNPEKYNTVGLAFFIPKTLDNMYIETGDDGHKYYVNKAAEELLGYEIIGQIKTIRYVSEPWFKYPDISLNVDLPI